MYTITENQFNSLKNLVSNERIPNDIQRLMQAQVNEIARQVCVCDEDTTCFESMKPKNEVIDQKEEQEKLRKIWEGEEYIVDEELFGSVKPLVDLEASENVQDGLDTYDSVDPQTVDID